MGYMDAEAAGLAPSPPAPPLARVVTWSSLVPLLLLLHPYGGLVQDARIYIGRGIADRDPAGIGRDILFAHDGQTGFSLMRHLVDAALSVVGPGPAALALALVGALLWLAAATALARSLAPARVAWAATVCMLVLPTRYGAFNVFNYAETIATPRVFAQAAVIGGLAALTTRRRWWGAALLALAAAFHPLIALPGLGIGAALLVRDDRRWLIPVAAAAALVLGAGVLGLPLASRLFEPMDAAWLSILRNRSTYLFPSLWPGSSFVPIVCQATALTAAAAFAAPRLRDLLVAALAVATLGVAASWLFGDLHPSTLVVQVQPWRALWPLALLGNAAVAPAAVALWRRGALGRVGIALLILTWLSSDSLPLAATLGFCTLFVVAALRRNVDVTLSRPAVLAVVALAIVALLVNALSATAAGVTLWRSAEAQGGEVLWPMLVGLGVQTGPLVLGAVALILRPARPWAKSARMGAAVAVACGFAAAAWLWDARPADLRFIERGEGDAALRQAIGEDRGEVLWVDEDSEGWFLADRPSFINTAQAGPILFSRDLAIEWAARAKMLLRLGLARPEDVAPWADARRSAQDLTLTGESVGAFCSDPRRPLALVAPGDQRGALPPAFRAALWRSPQPMRHLVIGEDELHWRTMALFTVVACAGVRADGATHEALGRPIEVEVLKSVRVD